jgi:signal transduction histidine kinase
LPQLLRTSGLLALVGAGSCALALGTILVARTGFGVAPVWPLNGLLVLLCLLRPGARHALALAGIAGAGAARATVGDPLPLLLSFCAADLIVIYTALLAWPPATAPGLVRPRLPRIVLRLAVALFAGSAVAGLVYAAALLALRGSAFWSVFEIAFLANALGLCITAPFVVVSKLAQARRTAGERRRTLAALLLVAAAVALAFGGFTRASFGPAVLPAQILATIAGGIVGGLASQVIVTIGATVTTGLGLGFFSRAFAQPAERLQFLQLLLACNGLAVLAVALMVERHRRLTSRLRQAHRQAVARSAGRTRLRNLLQRAPEVLAQQGVQTEELRELRTDLAAAERIREYTELREADALRNIEEVGLAPLLAAVSEDAAALARQRGVTLRVEAPPALRVLANRALLRQVVAGLVENGIQYRRFDRGHVLVTASEAEGVVRLVVEDDGGGIPPDKLGGLFRPFDRLGLGDEPIPGLGLHLAFARRVATLQGGNLVREPAEGGTRFVLTMRSAGAAGPPAALLPAGEDTQPAAPG